MTYQTPAAAASLDLSPSMTAGVAVRSSPVTAKARQCSMTTDVSCCVRDLAMRPTCIHSLPIAFAQKTRIADDPI